MFCLVLSVAQTIGDNFWDNMGTNSGTTLKENPPLCNAVLAGGGVLLCWVLSVAQTITNKTSRGQWKTSTTTKCRFFCLCFLDCVSDWIELHGLLNECKSSGHES